MFSKDKTNTDSSFRINRTASLPVISRKTIWADPYTITFPPQKVPCKPYTQGNSTTTLLCFPILP